jgi:hypothetical protein
MQDQAEQALKSARDLADQVNKMIGHSSDLDLQRLLKQIEADLMDVQHKLSLAVRLTKKG